MDYKDKYLKYKNKYINLKKSYKLLGGEKMLLITSPHSYCNYELINDTTHVCDKACLNIINVLVDILNTNQHKYNLLVNNNIERKVCDLNRELCKPNGDRSDLTEFIKSFNDYLPVSFCLLDIHSFPENHHDVKYDMYIIYNDQDSDMVKKIFEYLKLNLPNMIFGIFRSKDNYLISQANKKNLPALLLEFPEYNLRDDFNVLLEKRKLILSKLILWIYSNLFAV